MRALLYFCATVFISSTANAAEIVQTKPPHELKLYSRQLVVRATCELVKELDRDDRSGTPVPYCSCAQAADEIQSVVRKKYPAAIAILFMGPAEMELKQSLAECGVKPLDVPVEVRQYREESN